MQKASALCVAMSTLNHITILTRRASQNALHAKEDGPV